MLTQTFYVPPSWLSRQTAVSFANEDELYNGSHNKVYGNDVFSGSSRDEAILLPLSFQPIFESRTQQLPPVKVSMLAPFTVYMNNSNKGLSGAELIQAQSSDENNMQSVFFVADNESESGVVFDNLIALENFKAKYNSVSEFFASIQVTDKTDFEKMDTHIYLIVQGEAIPRYLAEVIECVGGFKSHNITVFGLAMDECNQNPLRVNLSDADRNWFAIRFPMSMTKDQIKKGFPSTYQKHLEYNYGITSESVLKHEVTSLSGGPATTTKPAGLSWSPSFKFSGLPNLSSIVGWLKSDEQPPQGEHQSLLGRK
ncbi:hypothetical protein Lbir_0658 [Legionella birminghamensis]|uniref:Uncharacterized protein n=1 Tax=Legionella birminghamensis TaxID=28083 RepID=A0A378I9E9_9GAMM|nr:hypothetical protein [Legionella birminghamensis]KTC74868.1 hypothetical protein Lbir_0658 [Legionella birminghamensis]STX31769.1 Uncharacterised protein [Legionella birminghamensis]